MSGSTGQDLRVDDWGGWTSPEDGAETGARSRPGPRKLPASRKADNGVVGTNPPGAADFEEPAVPQNFGGGGLLLQSLGEHQRRGAQ